DVLPPLCFSWEVATPLCAERRPRLPVRAGALREYGYARAVTHRSRAIARKGRTLLALRRRDPLPHSRTSSPPRPSRVVDLTFSESRCRGNVRSPILGHFLEAGVWWAVRILTACPHGQSLLHGGLDQRGEVGIRFGACGNERFQVVLLVVVRLF